MLGLQNYRVVINLPKLLQPTSTFAIVSLNKILTLLASQYLNFVLTWNADHTTKQPNDLKKNIHLKLNEKVY